ncbi:MAG: nickel-dependent lactate racemase, partial [Chloroflexota bacterium]|nr:nickel-dependent lactate racemase [Chloroflexota bacterium]
MTGIAVHSRPEPGLVDPVSAARRAVQTPLVSPRLRDLAIGAQTVCIAVTDATRACPDHLLVPPMLAELAGAQITPDAVTILVATGAHRPSTEAERREKLGDVIVDKYRIIDHDAVDTGGLVVVDPGEGGIPFRVNRTAVEADLLIATGVVEPHQYAGYSGGGKTVAIGCADEAIIAYTHGPAMLDQLGTRLAQLTGNPFQALVRRVARAAGLKFAANAVLGDHGQPVAIAYGAPESVHDHLAELAGRMFTVPIPHQVDVAVAGVGYPKDANLYQASRAASYLQFAPIQVVRRGGTIVLPAACPEGAGEGAGEKRFAAAMRQPGGTQGVIDRARAEGIRPGEQRAYVMARVLQDVHVVVTGAESPNEIQSLGFDTAATIEDALLEAR